MRVLHPLARYWTSAFLVANRFWDLEHVHSISSVPQPLGFGTLDTSCPCTNKWWLNFFYIHQHYYNYQLNNQPAERYTSKHTSLIIILTRHVTV